MISKIDEETLDFICRKGLTVNQFAICLLIYHKDVKGIIRYTEEIGMLGDALITKSDGTKITEIADLIARGFLLNHGLDRRDEYALDNFVVTDQFTDGLLIGTENVAQELYALYPKYLLIDNQEKPTKVLDFDDFEQKYLKAINHNVNEHKKVILRLRTYLASNKYAKCNLMNFVTSRYWNEYMTDESASKSRLY